MFVDACAIIALLSDEPEAERVLMLLWPRRTLSRPRSQ